MAANQKWELYKKQPGFVLGFHGCDEEVGEKVLSGKERHLKPSANDYDWLGGGIYFWEHNPARALQFAEQAAGSESKVSKGRIKKPFVIGAIIDLGNCCNLLDSSALDELATAHAALSSFHQAAGVEMPVNKGGREDLALRFLDKAVIKAMHDFRANGSADSTVLAPYDSVRAAFWEGGELYSGAGFSKKAHIQIAVCNTDCIKGYFRPLPKV